MQVLKIWISAVGRRLKICSSIKMKRQSRPRNCRGTKPVLLFCFPSGNRIFLYSGLALRSGELLPKSLLESEDYSARGMAQLSGPANHGWPIPFQSFLWRTDCLVLMARSFGSFLLYHLCRSFIRSHTVHILHDGCASTTSLHRLQKKQKTSIILAVLVRYINNKRLPSLDF